jgi:succinoglycan biosynthesis transport protein ExoP
VLTNGPDNNSSLHAFLAFARRRGVLVVACGVVAAGVALLLAFSQQPLYQASARVLLTYENFAAALTSTPDTSGVLQQPERVAGTQVSLARLPTLAARTLRAAGFRDTAYEDFLAASNVSAEPDADLLTFSVTNRDQEVARRLATEYARQFTAYRRALDTAALRQARAEVEQRLARLRPESDPGGGLRAELVAREKQLRTIETLQTSNAFLVDPARRGVQVEPRPLRSGALGLFLGLLLGFALAYLADRLDTRVRSTDEIEDYLRLPLLGRLSTRAGQRSAQSLAMLTELDGESADSFRVLRNNVELASLDRNVRVLQVTSAVAGEGKTTTAANLAIAFALAGQRVVLVDLDLRKPDVGRLFDLDDRPGLTNVVLGRATLEEALATISIADHHDRSRLASGQNGHRFTAAELKVLSTGPLPPDPGDFVGRHAVTVILEDLRARSDLVIVDCPPLLGVGDAVFLSRKSDALILVTRLGIAQTTMLREVRRVLETCRAEALGFVLTGARSEEQFYHASYQSPVAGKSTSAKRARRRLLRQS